MISSYRRNVLKEGATDSGSVDNIKAATNYSSDQVHAFSSDLSKQRIYTKGYDSL